MVDDPTDDWSKDLDKLPKEHDRDEVPKKS